MVRYMRLVQIITAVFVVGGFAAAGCGNGSSTRTTQATQTPSPAGATQVSSTPSAAITPATGAASQAVIRPAPVTISVSAVGLPAQAHEGVMPPLAKRNTCDGANVWLPFVWSGVPSGTAELALFIVNLRPVNEAVFVDWAVAGLSPTSQGILGGELPSGAVVGRNGFGRVGYSICPPKGRSETYIARLVALSHSLHPRAGFDAKALYLEAARAAKAVGLGGAGSYSR
jgi:phosphatidylethanolamine-binding protein (PEBP) family uncharacterized protein